jgi:hypothetical protein
MLDLTKSQAFALSFVNELAGSKQKAARGRVDQILRSEGQSLDLFDRALSFIAANPRVDVSFHPDRPDSNGVVVVDALSNSGQYKNQFETGISNGGLTAFNGGARDIWEQGLFGGAYQESRLAGSDRPKYGAMNLYNHWDGACPRFGSCYFRLKADVAKRCTFSFGDSSIGPSEIGTIGAFDTVLAAGLDELKSTGRALGEKHLDAAKFLGRVIREPNSENLINFDAAPGRNLDGCIEVHIHGPVSLSEDVEYLVVDGAFQDTPIGERLIALGKAYEFEARWSPGFFLAASKVPQDFRGPVMPALAKFIANQDVLDCVAIGQAVVSLREDPSVWEEWGSFDETLQYLKQMWHVLVRFGDRVAPSAP